MFFYPHRFGTELGVIMKNIFKLFGQLAQLEAVHTPKKLVKVQGGKKPPLL